MIFNINEWVSYFKWVAHILNIIITIFSTLHFDIELTIYIFETWKQKFNFKIYNTFQYRHPYTIDLLPNTQNCCSSMRKECRDRFHRPPRVSDPDMHHGTFVTHVPWCMAGSLTSGFLWSWWRGKLSRHSRRMRNPQFYVSGKRSITVATVFVKETVTLIS